MRSNQHVLTSLRDFSPVKACQNMLCSGVVSLPPLQHRFYPLPVYHLHLIYTSNPACPSFRQSPEWILTTPPRLGVRVETQRACDTFSRFSPPKPENGKLRPNETDLHDGTKAPGSWKERKEGFRSRVSVSCSLSPIRRKSATLSNSPS